MLCTVKPEPKPIWEWPVPAYVNLAEVPKQSVHPFAHQRPMDASTYLTYFDQKPGEIETVFMRDPSMHLIVCQEIEKVPGIWRIPSRATPTLREWANVGVAVYNRTGHMVTIGTIRKIWSLKKTNLKCRMRRAFAIQQYTQEELEHKMWEFGADYYVSRFYRRQMQDLEKALRAEWNYTVDKDSKIRQHKVFQLDDSDDEDAPEAQRCLAEQVSEDDNALFVEHVHIEAPQDPGPTMRAEQERAKEQERLMKSLVFHRDAEANQNRAPLKRRSADAVMEGPPRAPQKRKRRRGVLETMLAGPPQRMGVQSRQENHPPQSIQQIAMVPRGQNHHDLTQAEIQDVFRKYAEWQQTPKEAPLILSPRERAFIDFHQRMQAHHQHQMEVQRQREMQREQIALEQQQQQQQQQQQTAAPPPPYHQQPHGQERPAYLNQHRPHLQFVNTLLENFVQEYPDRVILMTSVIQSTLGALCGDLPKNTDQTEIFDKLGKMYPNYVTRYD